MPPSLEQRKWVQDVLHVVKLTDHEEVEEAKRKDSLRGDISSGTQKIDEQVGLMALAVRTFFKAYGRGLETFGIAMLDQEIDDKEATSVADIAFKIFLGIAAAAFPEAKLAEKLVEKLVARIGDSGKKLGENAAASIKEITTGALEKARDRIKDAPKPSARTFRAFAKALGDASVPDSHAMEEAVLRGGKSVKDAFTQMATAAGTVEGPASAFVDLAVAAGQAFTKRLNDQSDPNKMEQMFATEFAGKAGQTPKRTSLLDSTRDAGTLYFEITTVTDMGSANPGFTLGNDTDERWKLVMLGDKRDAEGAARALLEAATYPWKIDLPHKVKIDVYNMVNKKDANMCSGWLVFKKGNTGTAPDSIENVRGSFAGWDTGKRPEEWLRLAWSNKTVQAAATTNADLVGDVD